MSALVFSMPVSIAIPGAWLRPCRHDPPVTVPSRLPHGSWRFLLLSAFPLSRFPAGLSGRHLAGLRWNVEVHAEQITGIDLLLDGL